MAFLRNDAINRVNLHFGIHALAQGAGGVFLLAFLLRAGVPVPVALLAQAAILAGRFAIRPAILPLAKRFGLKPLLITGTVGIAVQYPLLAEVHGVGGWLLALIVVASVGEVFYWISYNAYFAALGDAEHRGHQIGAREALAAAIGIVAPLLGASALVAAGPRLTFAVVAVVQALAALPLVGLPNVPVQQVAPPGAFRAARLGAALMAIDGWFDGCFIFVWQIALFVSLGENIPAFGGAMAVAGLIGAAFALMHGRHVDTGHGRRVVAIGYATGAAIVVLRAASLGSPFLAVTANAVGAVVFPLLGPALATATYNMAKAAPCTFRFQMVTEASWDVGGFSACVVAAALSAAGASLSVAVLLALPGLAAGAALLWRYYAPGAAGGAALAEPQSR